MNKTEAIARRVLGWKLNRWDRWYDCEKSTFIPTTDFQPEQNLGHAMLIVERLEKFGFFFSNNGGTEARFNDVKATGNSLAEAITNAAYHLIENSTEPDSRKIWSQLC
ncbi:hypothetical protein [Bacillus sp. B15-48]|uniref:BC1872 family protein n=1 Tax=Bacillus sp. B15-48 TaxID=1548601 RepID=UPI00193F3352|nr:hypothetical protein [Bacillus sp. B15-48]MBM4761987.1 hypothetical protein [Bacillus sp. B15-48]